MPESPSSIGGGTNQSFYDFFINDQTLTQFWAKKMTDADREKFFSHIDMIEKEMRAEEHTPETISCRRSIIKESSENESEEETDILAIGRREEAKNKDSKK